MKMPKPARTVRSHSLSGGGSIIAGNVAKCSAESIDIKLYSRCSENFLDGIFFSVDSEKQVRYTDNDNLN
jgi:hypothetical protein